MLVRAQEKAPGARSDALFAAADALQLPFADSSFDLITPAFGFRNLANYEDGLREFARVLRRGGELGILEFTEPGAGPLGSIFRFYFRQILPRVGGAISGDKEAYAYLPGSVSKVSISSRTRRADGEDRLRRDPHHQLEFRQRDPALGSP